ncbi:MAG: 3' terminal RNA ribose 2'-O-methyltransferase Hen1 [Acidobacteriota bacterium]
MILTITSERAPATDLGYLLHKNPARVHDFDLPFGKATVFYPEATDECCTAALLLHVDPIGLVRRPKGASPGFALEQYVNDRPYSASSYLSVAISRVFGTALSGRCSKRPELVEETMPLRAKLAALPSRGGPAILERLFQPLGYSVETTRHPLDENFPEWGDSAYYAVELQAEKTLKDLLSHLYVLVPVLDDNKHYWVGEAEVEKLLHHAESWLGDHPEKTSIAERYLKHRRNLVDDALSRLLDEDPTDPDEARESSDRQEEAVEQPLKLNEIRLRAVVDALLQAGAKRVLDLGCGEGKLIRLLLRDKSFEEIVGLDVSHRALEIAQKRLHWDRMPERQRRRIRLLHGSLTYRDRRLEGYDGAALVEVIEHLEAGRLRALERTVFEFARPATVIVTTPNREYNAKFETLASGRMRHPDHRFEWNREEFTRWANDVAESYGYSVRFVPIGPEDGELGPPTQMGVFRR